MEVTPSDSDLILQFQGDHPDSADATAHRKARHSSVSTLLVHEKLGGESLVTREFQLVSRQRAEHR
jgi:hypothetical protein